MNTIRFIFNHLQRLCAVGLLVCFSQQNYLLAPARPREQKHQHRAQADILSELQPGIAFVRVKPPEASARENVCTTRDRRFMAYTASMETERLFIRDNKRGVVYEVRGLPLEHRPLNDLEWSARNRLRFDRWSQPHHGVHYEVDAVQKKLVIAYAFPD